MKPNQNETKTKRKRSKNQTKTGFWTKKNGAGTVYTRRQKLSTT